MPQPNPPPPPSPPHRIPHQKILWHRTDCFGVIGFRTDIICLLHILFGNLVKHVSWGAEFQNHLEKAKVQGQNHTCSIGFHKCPLVFVGFHILSWFSIGFHRFSLVVHLFFIFFHVCSNGFLSVFKC